jgi:acyl carrier protein
MVGILPKEGLRTAAPPLTRAEVSTRVAALILGQLDSDTAPAEITDTTSLADIGLDSLDHVELIIDIEDAFGIEITDEAMERVTTHGEAVNVVIEALTNAGRPLIGEVA